MLFNDCLRCVGFRLATESVRSRSRSRFGVGVGVGDIRSAHTHSTQKEDTRRCADKIVMPPKTDVDLRRTLLSGLFNLFDCSFSTSVCVRVCVWTCSNMSVLYARFYLSDFRSSS